MQGILQNAVDYLNESHPLHQGMDLNSVTHFSGKSASSLVRPCVHLEKLLAVQHELSLLLHLFFPFFMLCIALRTSACKLTKRIQSE